MNLTITVDEEVLARAREVAQDQGTSVQELIRAYLESLTGQRAEQRKALGEALVEHMSAHPGKPGNWKWKREDAYTGRLDRWGK